MPTEIMGAAPASIPAIAVEPELAALSAYGKARSTVHGAPLDADMLQKIHAYWRACNYLSLGMIYLQDNPLLREALKPEHVKNAFWDTGAPALASHPPTFT